jgi:hypothetical protein
MLLLFGVNLTIEVSQMTGVVSSREIPILEIATWGTQATMIRGKN